MSDKEFLVLVGITLLTNLILLTLGAVIVFGVAKLLGVL